MDLSKADCRVLPELEVASLVHRLQDGDEDALGALLMHNIGLVYAVLKGFCVPPSEFEDCVSEGIMGLIEACYRYDSSYGAKFGTYASYWIGCFIGRHIARNNGAPLCLTEGARRRIRQIKKGISLLRQQLNREPSIAEIAEEVGMKARLVSYYLRVSEFEAVPLARHESPFTEILDDRYIPNYEFGDWVSQVFTCLTEREKHIIVRRFFHNETLQEVSDGLDISRERVRQIQEESLCKMRKKML